ncbi:MAG: mechanosensitive ion channel, partial [Clostridia bacterium]|nr:mechanosensitive ion channel [Clostridia bacterium]
MKKIIIRGIVMDLKSIWEKLTDISIDYALKIVSLIVILIVGKLIIKFIMKRFLNGRLFARMDNSARSILRSTLKVVLNVVLIVIIVAVIGIPMASVVTVVASAGAAIALALQGSLANVASGVILIVTRPFRVDDWITVGDKTGQVTDIGFFYTTIRTVENLDVAIPNVQLTSAVMVNCSAQATRRANFTVSVAYGSDAEKVRTVILDYLAGNPLVVKDPEPFCAMNSMSESSL